MLCRHHDIVRRDLRLWGFSVPVPITCKSEPRILAAAYLDHIAHERMFKPVAFLAVRSYVLCPAAMTCGS